MRKDPVTDEVATAVARRDEYRCQAPLVDGQAGWCHDRWGNPITRWGPPVDPVKLTYAHVKDEDKPMMGKRAPSDAGHLVLLCWGHHEGNGVIGAGGSVWGLKTENVRRLRRHIEEAS